MRVKHGRNCKRFSNRPNQLCKEDTQRKGMLFAGAKAVFVSFDDGEHWQSLKRYASDIRSRPCNKDDDLVIRHAWKRLLDT